MNSLWAASESNARKRLIQGIPAGIVAVCLLLSASRSEEAGRSFSPFKARAAAEEEQAENNAAPVPRFTTNKVGATASTGAAASKAGKEEAESRSENRSPIPVFSTTRAAQQAESDSAPEREYLEKEDPPQQLALGKKRSTGFTRANGTAPQITVSSFNIPESSIPQEELDLILDPMKDAPLGLAELKARIREALQEAYRERGIKGVQIFIPPQTIRNRELLVNVIEPKLGKITIEGNRYFKENNLRRLLKGISTTNGTIVIEQLEQRLRRANRHPDRKVAVVLKKGEQAGETDIVMRVKEREAIHGISPLHVSTGIANTGSASTGRLRVNHAIQYTNVLGKEHVAGVTWQYNPEDINQVRAVSGSYQIPLGLTGHSLSFFGGHSDVESPTSQDGLELFGNSIIAGVQANFELPEFWNMESMLSLGVEWTKLKNTIDFAGQEVLDSNLGMLPLTTRYSFVKRGATGVTAGNLGFRYHMGGLASRSDQADFDIFREGAPSDFLVVELGLQRYQRLGERFMLNVDLKGQWSPDDLLPAEQMHIGGASTVRGIERSEVSGDQGFIARAEIEGPPMRGPLSRISSADDTFTVKAFLDYGMAYLEDTTGKSRSSDIAGAGVGVSYRINSYIEANVDAGTALMDAQQTESGDIFVHFNIAIRF
ncbi:MAG: ShlB/FhaC/HecB family hemolysin secretion/activation protein [Planctomycetota bacterium]|nr:ShlB/FhaC/HecB family hemolysin secretion/activation protein [Planctomycetota bacterium]